MDRELLLRWRIELVEELERLDGELAHVRALISELGEDSPVGVRKYRKSKYFEASRAAYETLCERGESMHRDELFGVVAGLGFSFSGRNPLKTFSSVLSYDGRFRRGSSRGLWELVEWPMCVDVLSLDVLQMDA